MTYYDRYCKGECEQVHAEILDLGTDAFAPEFFPDVDRVLTETFLRVNHNLCVIHGELLDIDYPFRETYRSPSEMPIHAPLPDTDALLVQLQSSVAQFGHVPFSLQYFYKLVGGVNFAWDPAKREPPWPLADPLQIASLDSVVEEVTNESWHLRMQEILDHDFFGVSSLDLSADAYHKDNLSGGEAYTLQLTKKPSIDSELLNEPNHTTFIAFLRISFDSCGFPGMARPGNPADFRKFCDIVLPKLKQI